MLGEEPCKVSLVGANGSFIGDLTEFITGGTANRKKMDVSTANCTFSSNKDSWGILRKIKPWATYLRIERDGRDQWEGPVTNAVDGLSFDVTASDMGAYWKRTECKTATYSNTDVIEVAEGLISQALMKAPYGLPIMDTTILGSLVTKTYSSTEYLLLDDALQSLPGLEYYFFGRTLFLFGAPEFAKSVVKLNDESWFPTPTVELAGDVYANRIIVKGSSHVGVAEAPTAEINYYGLLSRRFDRPELSTQSAVNAEAERLLLSVRDSIYLNTDSGAFLDPKVNISLDRLVPGAYVDVSHYVGAIPLDRQMRINEVSLDIVSSQVSLVLEPLGAISEEG